MHGNIFSVVNENFFGLLAGKNKRIYADCLIALDREYQTMMPEDFTRNALLDIVKDVMSIHNYSFDADDVEEKVLLENEREKDNTNIKENLAISRMAKCGWIEISEPNEEGERFVSFTDAALTVLPALHSLTSSKKVSLGGYTRNIIDNLKRLKAAKKPYTDAFVHAFKLTEEFIKDMDRIRLEIKKDIKAILECEDYSQSYKMLDEYFDKSLNGDYYLIQFQEALDGKTSSEIADCIIATRENDELMEKLIEGAADYHGMSREEAEAHILTRLEIMYNHLYFQYDERYDRILNEQRKYIGNASAKINAFMFDRKNVRGLIKNILIELNKETVSDEWDDETDPEWASELQNKLGIPGSAHLDERSIYSPRKTTPIHESAFSEISMKEPTDEEFKKNAQMEQTLYTKPKVEAMIKKLIEGKEELKSDEIPLNSTEDFAKLIGIAITTKSQKLKYELEFSSTNTNKNGYEIPDFVIRKRR